MAEIRILNGLSSSQWIDLPLNGCVHIPDIGGPIFWPGQIVECQAILIMDGLDIGTLEATFRGFSKAVSGTPSEEIAVDIFFSRKVILIEEGRYVNDDHDVLKFKFKIPLYTEPQGGDRGPVPPSMRTERGCVSYCVYLNGKLSNGDEMEQVKTEIGVITWTCEAIPDWKAKPTPQLLGQIKWKPDLFKDRLALKTKRVLCWCCDATVRMPRPVYEVVSWFPTQLYLDQEFDIYLQLKRSEVAGAPAAQPEGDTEGRSLNNGIHEEEISLLINSMELCLWEYTVLRIRTRREIQGIDLGRQQQNLLVSNEITLDEDMVLIINGFSLIKLLNSSILPTFHTFAVERRYCLEITINLHHSQSSKDFNFDTYLPIMILPPNHPLELHC
eukprot:Protomagalhaensia_sp_Gyna_25__4320@NODE_394_length_3589_cov_22_704789_g303_i0_p2_GENE_NODE_394_length_3589_cov_22_704789_g303_i0NODE_394_length_3589_cov_22_704789_g303_i0_p2_ORF_typecomplete_len385_score41_56Bul1_C/PF04426_12/1_1e04Bul1_C/PF04426_12/0_00041_NODE_394_length_3589_cov_22_704789_g303_i06321786